MESSGLGLGDRYICLPDSSSDTPNQLLDLSKTGMKDTVGVAKIKVNVFYIF